MSIETEKEQEGIETQASSGDTPDTQPEAGENSDGHSASDESGAKPYWDPMIAKRDMKVANLAKEIDSLKEQLSQQPSPHHDKAPLDDDEYEPVSKADLKAHLERQASSVASEIAKALQPVVNTFNEQSIERRRQEWVKDFDSSPSNPLKGRGQEVLTKLNDRMDELYGDIELTDEQYQNASGKVYRDLVETLSKEPPETAKSTKPKRSAKGAEIIQSGAKAIPDLSSQSNEDNFPRDQYGLPIMVATD